MRSCDVRHKHRCKKHDEAHLNDVIRIRGLDAFKNVRFKL